MAVGEHFTGRARETKRLYESGRERLQHTVFVVAEIIHVDREAPPRLEAHNIAHAVEEAAMPVPVDAIAGTCEGARRSVVSIAVDDEDAGLLERRNKKDCRVRLVMAHVKDLGQTLAAELALQIVAQPEV